MSNVDDCLDVIYWSKNKSDSSEEKNKGDELSEPPIHPLENWSGFNNSGYYFDDRMDDMPPKFHSSMSQSFYGFRRVCIEKEIIDIYDLDKDYTEDLAKRLLEVSLFIANLYKKYGRRVANGDFESLFRENYSHFSEKEMETCIKQSKSNGFFDYSKNKLYCPLTLLGRINIDVFGDNFEYKEELFFVLALMLGECAIQAYDSSNYSLSMMLVIDCMEAAKRPNQHEGYNIAVKNRDNIYDLEGTVEEMQKIEETLTDENKSLKATIIKPKKAGGDSTTSKHKNNWKEGYRLFKVWLETSTDEHIVDIINRNLKNLPSDQTTLFIKSVIHDEKYMKQFYDFRAKTFSYPKDDSRYYKHPYKLEKNLASYLADDSVEFERNLMQRGREIRNKLKSK